MAKNKSSKSLKLLILIIPIGVISIGLIVFLFVIPRYDVSVKGAALQSSSIENSVKHINATINVDCGVVQVGSQLKCKQPIIDGDYGSNRDAVVSIGDKASSIQADKGNISFKPAQVSLKSVVVRFEPVKGPISNQYKIVMRNKSDNKEVAVYALTINTVLTENDTRLINKEPTAEAIKAAIEKIGTIKNVCIANEGNDPNNKLGKPGTYYIKLVFVDTRAPEKNTIYDEVLGDMRAAKDSCEKGVDAGGSIEVFRSKEDANKRKTELDGFSGGFFDSGTAKVVNKTVIRTASELKASEQKELEGQLLEVLTK